MTAKIEGNVRIITKDLTLYGSRLDYNFATGAAHIKNARILTSDFNLVSNELIRVNETQYVAKEAEFTTCKDCAESWSVYGKNISLKVGEYVQIRQGLFKVKGANVIYIPYLVLPMMAKRKTGLLVPRISSRPNEGMSLEQPIFVAVSDHEDLTLSPTFWAVRGYGGDIQYRKRFSEMSWFEANNRFVNDSIYEPGQSNQGKSGENFFRYFTELESHQFWSPNLGSHIRYSAVRDLDIIRDNAQFTDPKVTGSDLGLQGFVNFRQDLYNVGGEFDYLRNQLSSKSTKFDTSYVQVAPRLTLSTMPYSVVQSKVPFFNHIALGTEGSLTRFRQVDQDDTDNIRNADRVSIQPYVMWHLFTAGPMSLRTRYTYDQQSYKFADPDEPNFGKNAGLVKTELSFTIDRIFGLAYEEKVPLKFISDEELKNLRERKEQGLSPIQKSVKENRLVGEIPEFESELTKDNIVQVRNSYRHIQEYKFIHHYITSHNEYGNKRFLAQISNPNPTRGQSGQFDYEDALRSEEYLYGTFTSRTMMPPANTAELQWNNTLIRKAPKTFSYLQDDKYLKDNFNYTKISYFNVSQGYLVNSPEDADFREKLTRLHIDTGYNADRWFVNAQEHYYHYSNENIFSASFTRRFEYVNLFSNYTYNSFQPNNTNLVTFGGQLRPIDTLGVAMSKERDLEAKKDMRTVYSVDIMPNNNCWILNLNYQQRLDIDRYSFNIIFNFGDDNFERYRNDYFAVKRL